MQDNFPHLNENEQLQTENDFMKMKLMLERGAEFGTIGKGELNPELENVFLKNVMDFEAQFEQHKMIKVFDKIGKPTHFKPANEIQDTEIGKCWDELHDYLNKYGLDIDVCSPYISQRELYRFVIEELFEHETDDINLPGWTTNFIYDQFHPDPVYESEKAVSDDLFTALFRIEPVDEYFYCLSEADILLNGKMYTTRKEVNDVFNSFKSAFSQLELQEVTVQQHEVINAAKAIVSGYYKVMGVTKAENKQITFEGKFTSELQPDDLGYWSIKRMDIEAIAF